MFLRHRSTLFTSSVVARLRFQTIATTTATKRANFETTITVPRTKPKTGVPQVIFLLGWTNSLPKKLSKYREIYEKEGHAVITCCPSAYMVYGLRPRPKWDAEVDRLLRLLYDHHLQNRPVFFHLFSGGAFMYYLICKRLEDETHKEVRMTGTVMDSALTRVKPSLIYRAMFTVAPGNVFTKGLISFGGVFVAYFVMVGNIVIDALLKGGRVSTEDNRFFSFANLSTQPNLGPQLFLFSKADDVMDYRSVLFLIEKRKERGVEVYYKMWDDSKHVRHFQLHPDEYKSILNEFREKCCRKSSYSVHEEGAKMKGNELGFIQKWILK